MLFVSVLFFFVDIYGYRYFEWSYRDWLTSMEYTASAAEKTLVQSRRHLTSRVELGESIPQGSHIDGCRNDWVESNSKTLCCDHSFRRGLAAFPLSSHRIAAGGIRWLYAKKREKREKYKITINFELFSKPIYHFTTIWCFEYTFTIRVGKVIIKKRKCNVFASMMVHYVKLNGLVAVIIYCCLCHISPSFIAFLSGTALCLSN